MKDNSTTVVVVVAVYDCSALQKFNLRWSWSGHNAQSVGEYQPTFISYHNSFFSFNVVLMNGCSSRLPQVYGHFLRTPPRMKMKPN